MRTWSAWWPLLCVLTTNLVAVVYDCKSTLYLSKLEEYSPSEQTTSLARRVRRHLPECGEISGVLHGYSKSHGKWHHKLPLYVRTATVCRDPDLASC